MSSRRSNPTAILLVSGSAAALVISTWRILLWRARTRAKMTVLRVEEMLRNGGPLIDVNNSNLTQRILENAIKRASKWMSLREDAKPLSGQVGGRGNYRKPCLSLPPEYVLKPLAVDDRGIREVAFYEAMENVTKANSNTAYSQFLSFRKEKNAIMRAFEMIDTVALALAIMVSDPFVSESEESLREAWKNVRKEVDALHKLQRFVPRYHGVVGQDAVARDSIVLHPYGITNDAYLLLQSLTVTFCRPCVMDLKMGTQTFEPDAPQEKRSREFGKYPKQQDFGFRIVGMRVFEPGHEDADEKGYRSFGKQFGRSLESREAVVDAFKTFFSSGTRKGENGEPAERVRTRAISNALLELRPIRRWFEENKSLEFRASSLLLIYEGDPEKGNGDVTMIKMIDFTHVRRESGGDEGYRYGLKTLNGILSEIMDEEKNRLSKS